MDSDLVMTLHSSLSDVPYTGQDSDLVIFVQAQQLLFQRPDI